MPPELRALVADELTRPVDPRVAALAGRVAERHRGAARAVLFYGSCLRSADLDGQMLDFYLIVSRYRDAYAARWLAAANRLIPPNVFPIEADGLAAKYAVLSAADFARLCGPQADNPSVWARFAQPARIAWVANDAARESTIDAVAQAAPTLIARALPILPAAGRGAAALEVWRIAFRLTYGAELRAERGARPDTIVDADPDRYRRFSGPALTVAGGYAASGTGEAEARRGWRRTQRLGKLLTALRLLKASATFAGGLDYLAWKINRHAGTAITIRPWQRRWPVAGALSLLPRLLRRGAVR